MRKWLSVPGGVRLLKTRRTEMTTAIDAARLPAAYVSLEQVKNRYNICTATVYSYVKLGLLPRPIHLSVYPRANFWRAAELPDPHEVLLRRPHLGRPRGRRKSNRSQTGSNIASRAQSERRREFVENYIRKYSRANGKIPLTHAKHNP